MALFTSSDIAVVRALPTKSTYSLLAASLLTVGVGTLTDEPKVAVLLTDNGVEISTIELYPAS